MIISDSHNFIFVRIRKAAGGSIREILEPLSAPKPKDLLSKIKSRYLHIEKDYHKYAFNQHDDIMIAKRVIPKQTFDNYFKFAFVRNPWTRLVSEYEYIKRKPDHGRYSKVVKMSFDQYIKYQATRFDAHQINMLADKNGNLQMDFIGKFENLLEDWSFACNKLNIVTDPLGHHKKAPKADYKNYYGKDKNKDLVAKFWERDIATFGYSFEEL